MERKQKRGELTPFCVNSQREGASERKIPYFNVDIKMSSVDSLRKFVADRLNAAVEEIFGVLERTIVEYEEEISRQRRLLDITYNSDLLSLTTDVPSQEVFKEKEVSSEHQPCAQVRNSRLDQEPPKIKEEHQELCTEQQEEHLELKQESDRFIITSSNEQSDLCKGDALHRHPRFSESGAEIEPFWRVSVQNSVSPEPNTEPQLLSHVRETQDYTEFSHEERGSISNAETETEKQDTESSAQTPSDKNSGLPLSFHFSQAGRPENLEATEQNDQHLTSNSQSNSWFQPSLESSPCVKSSKKSVICPVCGKALMREAYLKIHIRSHTGEKPYLCKTCGKRFDNTSSLNRHVKIHTGERPHVCKTCGKGFPNIDRLNRHTRIHTNERPYSCQTCKKVFRYSSDMLIHIRRVHTGEKPYACQTCGQRFSELSKLKRHMRIHRDETLF